MTVEYCKKCKLVFANEDCVIEGSIAHCPRCNEITEETCGYCLGEGEVSCDERDESGNIMRGVGTQKCICRVKEQEYDNQQD